MIRPYELGLSYVMTSYETYKFVGTDTDMYLDDANFKSFSYVAGVEVNIFLCKSQTREIAFRSHVSLEVIYLARNGV